MCGVSFRFHVNFMHMLFIFFLFFLFLFFNLDVGGTSVTAHCGAASAFISFCLLTWHSTENLSFLNTLLQGDRWYSQILYNSKREPGFKVDLLRSNKIKIAKQI